MGSMADAPSWLTSILLECVSYLGGHHDDLTPIDGAKKVMSLTHTEVG